MKVLQKILTLLFITVLIPDMTAQEKPLSTAESVSGTINGVNITINYGSPSVRDREIWGVLVPYDKLWRAGANAATTFTSDKDLTVEGKLLPAGSYAFFVIPGKSESVVIFNKVAAQRGTSEYKEENDQIRVTVKQEAIKASTEKLVYTIEKDRVVLRWANWNIPVKIK